MVKGKNWEDGRERKGYTGNQVKQQKMSTKCAFVMGETRRVGQANKDL
jgi:hypothetical protein